MLNYSVAELRVTLKITASSWQKAKKPARKRQSYTMPTQRKKLPKA